MDLQRLSNSTSRSMNSCKALVGVALNDVITFVNKLCACSTSVKHIVFKCGVLNHFVAGDLILADKGFSIQNVAPAGVSFNIPPFLEHGKLSKSKIIQTKSIAKCQIHAERANARLKSFKILTLIPSWLRGYFDVIFRLVAALVNLRFPLNYMKRLVIIVHLNDICDIAGTCLYFYTSSCEHFYMVSFIHFTAL